MTETRSNVLFVEDDTEFVDAFRPLLETFCSVDVANCGDEAVEKLLASEESNQRYRLIILDMWVPHRSGEDVDREFGINLLLKIENQVGLVDSGTPIFVLTGNPSYDDCVKSIRCGAVDYLPKCKEEDVPQYMSPMQRGEGLTNVGEAIRRIRRILGLPMETSNQEPGASLDRWMKRNGDEIKLKFAGKHLGVVSRIRSEFLQHMVDSLEQPTFLVDGRVVIVRNSDEQVRHSFLMSRELRWDEINVLYIPDNEGTALNE